jgi:hypothetical protein
VIRGTRSWPATVAPFRAWRGLRGIVAQSPKFHRSPVGAENFFAAQPLRESSTQVPGVKDCGRRRRIERRLGARDDGAIASGAASSLFFLAAQIPAGVEENSVVGFAHLNGGKESEIFPVWAGLKLWFRFGT